MKGAAASGAHPNGARTGASAASTLPGTGRRTGRRPRDPHESPWIPPLRPAQGAGRWPPHPSRFVPGWCGRAFSQLRDRWRRSLQLRVVGTTLAVSALVVTALGFFLMQQIAAGLLENTETTAVSTTFAGMGQAVGNPALNRPPVSSAQATTLMNMTAKELLSGSSPGDNYDVAIYPSPQRFPHTQLYSNGWSSNFSLSSIPGRLKAKVAQAQRRGDVDAVYKEPTRLVQGSQSTPALAVGVPLGDYYQLYYVFPLTGDLQTLQLVQQTLLGGGLVLVVLLALIASLVTRWVVVPVRRAADAAQRVSEGDLDERMQVHGIDDLAVLATSFNEMAASLQDKLAELQDLSQVQRQFVSDVSHELRTPLTTIRIAADVLYAARDALDGAAARSAELLQGQVERFESLLADLLEISRYDANAATLDAEPVDICDLVRRSADVAQQLAERRGTRIEFRLPALPCVAEADRRRVERILRNLTVNAVEHGEGREVVVTVAGDRDAVAVAVRDFGVGMKPSEQQLVFDRFWRADPARARTSGGTGLGLSIALEDARLHGGWLEAWSEWGRGSVFRLTLPRVAGGCLVGSPLPLAPDEAVVTAGFGALPARFAASMSTGLGRTAGSGEHDGDG
jgi:two-component system sensor histidine kinase MtrB